MPLSTLIGRDEEAGALRALLLRPTVRLVTLAGPGGVGKTRLAIEVVSELDTGFDTVGFVPLASVRDPGLVPVTIGRAIDVPPSEEPLDALRDHLRSRSTLLILDNLEHLLGARAAVAELLVDAPGLTVLVTSRTLLRISGEQVFTVPPLALPDPGRPPPVRELDRFGAVRLFVERARAVRPGFVLDDDNGAVVVEICRRLDGLPLAIELAAARSTVLPPHALLARLERRLPLLTQGEHDQPERLRTMRAGIAWSHDLLSADEQRLFRCLAAFAGSCSLAAVESVSGQGSATLDVLAGLVDKSLVQQVAPAGEPRFSMSEIIREFALEQLEASGEEADARRAHAHHFLRLAEEAEPGLRGASQQQWRDRLETELDELRAALAWTLGPSVEPADAEIGLRLVGALWYFWFQRGLTGEGRGWLARALGATAVRGRSRAQALLGAGTLAWRQGDCATARDHLDESAALWRHEPDLPGLAESLHVLGHVRFDQRDYASARELFEESSDAYRRAGDVIGELPLVGDLGLVAYHEGDYGTAEKVLTRSVSLYREHGLKDRVAGALNVLGDLARLAGDDRRAATLYEESLVLWRELRGTPGIASALHKLGQVSRSTDDDGPARARFVESLELQLELGNKQGIGECLAGLAAVVAAAGDLVRAAQVFAASSTLLESIGVPLAPVDRLALTRDVEETRKLLGDPAWTQAWAEGSALSAEQAVRLVLLDESDDEPPPAVAAGSGADRSRTPLTPREREVSRLLARGLSNKEIAGALSISERTVGSHVDHIMTKLGIRSRTRIAIWAIEHGLGGPEADRRGTRPPASG